VRTKLDLGPFEWKAGDAWHRVRRSGGKGLLERLGDALLR